MPLANVVLKTTTTAGSQTFTGENIRPGGISTYADYAQGILSLRESVSFSSVSLSKAYHRQEIRIPYQVLGVDVNGTPVVASKSHTRIVRDFSVKLTTAQRVDEFERLSSLFSKTINPAFYNAWINGTPLLDY